MTRVNKVTKNNNSNSIIERLHNYHNMLSLFWDTLPISVCSHISIYYSICSQAHKNNNNNNNNNNNKKAWEQSYVQ